MLRLRASSPSIKLGTKVLVFLSFNTITCFLLANAHCAYVWYNGDIVCLLWITLIINYMSVVQTELRFGASSPYQELGFRHLIL